MRAVSPWHGYSSRGSNGRRPNGPGRRRQVPRSGARTIYGSSLASYLVGRREPERVELGPAFQREASELPVRSAPAKLPACEGGRFGDRLPVKPEKRVVALARVSKGFGAHDGKEPTIEITPIARVKNGLHAMMNWRPTPSSERLSRCGFAIKARSLDSAPTRLTTSYRSSPSETLTSSPLSATTRWSATHAGDVSSLLQLRRLHRGFPSARHRRPLAVASPGRRRVQARMPCGTGAAGETVPAGCR